jgi:predicted LPLAT superfamily acyltransferase
MNMRWQQRPEGGGRFAIWLIHAIARGGGRMLSRLLLYPITAYFLLVRGPERRASRAYLARVLGRPATLGEVARHLHCFASTILDRVFLLSGQLRRFDVRVSGLEPLHASMDEGRGVLLFGSHHGSFEALRVLSRERPEVQLRVVMDRAQNAVITQMLEALSPEIARTVIDARQDGVAITLAISEAARENALIGLLVDRAKAGEPTTVVPFLGAPAEFPDAPFLIASALRVPVVLSFGLYRGGRRYDLHFEPFPIEHDVPRAQRRAALARMQARYAQRLEHYVRLAPYNWFNFYDFWNLDAEHAPPQDPQPMPVDRAVAGVDRDGGGSDTA